ncbi:unnamed protein product [Lota lota]
MVGLLCLFVKDKKALLLLPPPPPPPPPPCVLTLNIADGKRTPCFLPLHSAVSHGDGTVMVLKGLRTDRHLVHSTRKHKPVWCVCSFFSSLCLPPQLLGL